MRTVVILTAVAMLVGCASSDTAAPAAPPEVRFAAVGANSAPSRIDIVGTIGLRRETSLGFTSAGRIATIRVDDGDLVRQGQLLAALDTTVVQSDLATARAERDRAAAEYARSSKLFADGWITKPRLESARATLAAADARVRATGFQTSNAVIVAPAPGRILARQAEPGQVVAAGTPVLVLGEASSGYILRVPLTDREAGAITVGAPARVTLAALEGVVLDGQVSEVAGRADRLTGTFAVEISLPADSRLRAGQLGKASIVSRGTANTLVVPPAAVFAPRSGEAFVYVLDPAKNRVRLRKVQIADATDGGTQVTGGLRAGERVATSRIDRLADNMAVSPIGIPR